MSSHATEPFGFEKKQRGPMVWEESRYKTSRSHFDWRGTPEGLVGLAVSYEWCSVHYGSDRELRKKKWSRLGLNKRVMLNALKAFYPTILEVHQLVMGFPLSEEKNYDRVHKMFWQKDPRHGDEKGGTANFKISREHPENDHVLGLVHAEVQKHLRKEGWLPGCMDNFDLQIVVKIMEDNGITPSKRRRPDQAEL